MNKTNLEKWEDSIEILFEMIQHANTPKKKQMAMDMLRILAREADNFEQQRMDELEQVKIKLEEIWHDNCSEKE